MMEILSFKVRGKLAHFRKYYANNTALSFTIPPRTTLMGIVAAAMGWPKDSYYEDLASEKINFGIRVLSPLKKSFHRLNFLSIKSLGDLAKKWSSDFRGEGGRIQTPFEVVSGWDISREEVEYQVFVKANEDGLEIFKKIKNHFLNHDPTFNITLGTANFTAQLHSTELVKSNSIQESTTKEFILLNSAVPVDLVVELKFEKEEFGNYNFVEEDMLPGDFMGNRNREVRKMNKLLFSTTPNPLRVRLNSPYFEIKTQMESIKILFID